MHYVFTCVVRRQEREERERWKNLVRNVIGYRHELVYLSRSVL